MGGSVNKHGRSAPNESFSYPAEDAASAAAAAEAAPAVMEFAAPPAAVVTEAAPGVVVLALALALLLALSSTKPADYTNHRARQENGEDADFRHHAQALPESIFSASH